MNGGKIRNLRPRAEGEADSGLALVAQHRGLVLAGLAAGTVALLFLTSAVSRVYRAHVERLAREWSARGEVAVRAHRPEDAVEAFENAQHYARHDPRGRMRLAEALLLAGRGEEARSHLLALWARAPGDGRVNLELARLAAADGRAAEAARYFDAAVHGSWEVAADLARRRARQELIALYLSRNALPQAEAQLIALAPDLPRDAESRTELGEDLLKTGSARRALEAFEAALASEPRHVRAAAGAGMAAFRLGDYSAARRHLRSAVQKRPDDPATGRALATTDLVLTMDPLLPRLRAAERARRLGLAWRTAWARVQACAASQGVALAADPQGPLLEGASMLLHAHRQLAALEPQITPGVLRRDPERIDSVMDAVLAAARASQDCGPLQPADEALLLIGRRHAADEP